MFGGTSCITGIRFVKSLTGEYINLPRRKLSIRLLILFWRLGLNFVGAPPRH